MPMKSHNPPGAPAPASRYSQAVEVTEARRWLHLSGQVGAAPDGTLAQGAQAQHEQTWRNILAILEAAGMGPQNLVKITCYVTSADQVATFREVRDRMTAGAKPAATLVVVAGLANPAWLVEIEAVAAA